MSGEQTQGMTKEAEAVARHRAFEVGIAHLCKQAGFSYNQLAEAAGLEPDQLSKVVAAEIRAAIDGA